MAFCGAPAWIVTCASTRFCAAGDFGGASVYSTAPAGGIGAWQNGPFSDSYVGLSCTSASFCLAGCAPGYGSGDGCDSSDANDYGAAVVFSWGLDRHGLPVTGTGFTEISPGQLNGIWCQDAHQCFASAYDGLYDATNPTGDPSAWHQVVRTRTGYSGAREVVVHGVSL